MRAILSDIHGNAEALSDVLAQLAQYHIHEIYCLGDTVGYGPNPRECVDMMMHSDMHLMGNHDQAAMFDPDTFSGPALRAIYWTRDELEKPIPSKEAREARWSFLGERPRLYNEEGALYVHGSPRNPINEYIFPEDIYVPGQKMSRLFEQFERVCFVGHTHVPGVFIEEQPGVSYKFYSPDEIDYTYELDGRKVIINVGSVGQPRDGDWRACYVIVDERIIRWCRLEYDVNSTIQKIYDTPDLDNFLGDRLRLGR